MGDIPKFIIDKSILESLFPGGVEQRNKDVDSSDILKNFAKRVDGVILRDEEILQHFVDKYKFSPGKDIVIQANKLINNYITVITDLLSDLSAIGHNISEIKSRTILDKDSYQYKKQQYFLKINYEIQNRKQLELSQKLNDVLTTRMGQNLSGEQDIDGLLKLDEFSSLSFTYNIKFDFGVFVKFFKIIKWNKDEVFNLIKLKSHSEDEYYKYVKNYIAENRVLEYINFKAKEHYLLSEKEEILSILLGLYQYEKYQAFVSLGAIQVEGLFYDFCSLINGGTRKSEEGTMINKVDKVFNNNRNQALIYYPYFAFDVPIYRNEVAHNGVASVKKAEYLAHDILLDMYIIIKLMQDTWLPFNNVCHFILGLKDKEKIKDYSEEYYPPIFTEMYGFLMLYRDINQEFGIFKIMKERDKHKDILTRFPTFYNGERTNLYDEIGSILNLFEEEKFWKYIFDTVLKYGFNGTNFADFIKKLVDEFIGYLPKKSGSHNYCIEINKKVQQYLKSKSDSALQQ